MPTGFEKKNRKNRKLVTASVDSKEITNQFPKYFTNIKDPRVQRTRWHKLTDIITISLLAVIAGAAGWEDIEEYGLNKQEWLKSKTSSRTFRSTDSIIFHNVFTNTH